MVLGVLEGGPAVFPALIKEGEHRSLMFPTLSKMHAHLKSQVERRVTSQQRGCRLEPTFVQQLVASYFMCSANGTLHYCGGVHTPITEKTVAIVLQLDVGLIRLNLFISLQGNGARCVGGWPPRSPCFKQGEHRNLSYPTLPTMHAQLKGQVERRETSQKRGYRLEPTFVQQLVEPFVEA